MNIACGRRAILDVTYEKLKGSLGSLLLVWAGVEKSLRDEVIRAHGSLPPKAYGIAALLRTWESTIIETQPATSLCPPLATVLRSQMQRPLNVRNGLCHGLVGIISATEQMPAALCWEMNGEKHSICWDELQEQLGCLSRLPRAISIISNPSLLHVVSRTTDTTENRTWWGTEFSLDVPLS